MIRNVEIQKRQIATILERAFIPAIIVLALYGMVVCYGWATDSLPLIRLGLSRNMIVSSGTAVSVLLSAIALLFLRTKKLSILGVLSSVLVLLASAATFVEAIIGQDYGLNQIIWGSSPDFPGLTYPGPMAPNASFSFFLLSLASIFSFWKHPKTQSIAQYLWLAVGLGGWTSLVGFICGADYLCTMFGCMRMTPTTSVPIAMLGLSAFFSNTSVGPAAIFASDGIGGRAARSMAIMLWVVPLLTYLMKLGETQKYYDSTFGWFVFGLVMIGFMVALAVANAKAIDNVDSARAAAEEKLMETSLLIKNLGSVKSEDGVSSKTVKTRNVCLSCEKEFPFSLSHCPDDSTLLVQLADDSMIGSVFCSKYFVMEKLGEGGMSHVYKVRHLHLDTIFAVKLLKSHLAVEALSVRRFLQEAKTAVKLIHPNLLRIHDFGVSSTGEPYLLMDYIEGKSLAELLDEIYRLDIDRFFFLFQQVLEGVEVAHKNGIVHRDLKPGNIMLLPTAKDEDLVKVVDFGLAKLIDSNQKITQTGEALGSPLYMSPEQCLGQSVDERSDIYALGCVMYECLVGQNAIRGGTVMMTMQKQMSERPAPIPAALKIPQDLEAVIMKCLEKRMEDRYQSIADLKEALAPIIKNCARV